MAQSVECGPCVREVESNLITHKIDTCCFLAWFSALIGYDKDWLAQFRDNVTEWDIGLQCRWPGFPVGEHYKVAMSANCHKALPVPI